MDKIELLPLEIEPLFPEIEPLLLEISNHLKSLVRERQRIWQILYQMPGDYRITLSKGEYRTVLRGSEKVGAAMRAYLHDLNIEIELLTKLCAAYSNNNLAGKSS